MRIAILFLLHLSVVGSAHEIPLHYCASAKAAFFDAPRSTPFEVEALLIGDNLDFAWCRVYPESNRQ